jgi:transposase-like protein
MNKIKCPECNSENLVKAGKCIVKREETQVYRCKDCKRLTHKPIVEVNNE